MDNTLNLLFVKMADIFPKLAIAKAIDEVIIGQCPLPNFPASHTLLECLEVTNPNAFDFIIFFPWFDHAVALATVVNLSGYRFGFPCYIRQLTITSTHRFPLLFARPPRPDVWGSGTA